MNTDGNPAQPDNGANPIYESLLDNSKVGSVGPPFPTNYDDFIDRETLGAVLFGFTGTISGRMREVSAEEGERLTNHILQILHPDREGTFQSKDDTFEEVFDRCGLNSQADSLLRMIKVGAHTTAEYMLGRIYRKACGTGELERVFRKIADALPTRIKPPDATTRVGNAILLAIDAFSAIPRDRPTLVEIDEKTPRFPGEEWRPLHRNGISRGLEAFGLEKLIRH